MDEALAILHKWIALTGQRDMFTATQVGDMLLDVQQALTRVPGEAPVLESV